MVMVGLIPARGGSKGIPNKNIAQCAGKPLLTWTCEAARGSVLLDRVLLSTDSEAIAEVGRTCGVEVPFLRPPELASDASPSIGAMVHALDWLEAGGADVEALILLQPTSPLRTAAHIDEGIRRFRQGGAATLVSVVEVPHRFHPLALMEIRGGKLFPHGIDSERVVVTRRQDLSPLYARNGPAILIVRPCVLRAGELYGQPTLSFVMGASVSLDVDGPEDLLIASALLAERTASGT